MTGRFSARPRRDKGPLRWANWDFRRDLRSLFCFNRASILSGNLTMLGQVAKVVVVSRTPFRIDETAALLRSGTLLVEVPVLMRTSSAGGPIPSPRHNLAAPESLPVATKDELRQ